MGGGGKAMRVVSPTSQIHMCNRQRSQRVHLWPAGEALKVCNSVADLGRVSARFAPRSALTAGMPVGAKRAYTTQPAMHMS
jgi:hypothetical protein